MSAESVSAWETYAVWLSDRFLKLEEEAEKLKAELAQAVKERDEARRLHSVLHDLASGGCRHTLLKHEHSCAVDAIKALGREAERE